MKFLTLLILLTLALPALAKTISDGDAKTTETLPVVRIIDGDTLVAGNKTIRLWGIDAPEKGEPYFFAAQLYLTTLVDNKFLDCKYKHRDRYYRYVMQCFSGKYDIASELVRMGVAKDYPKYSGGYYSKDEDFAKENNYGVWSATARQ